MADKFKFVTDEDKTEIKQSIFSLDLSNLRRAKEQSLVAHEILSTDGPVGDQSAHQNEITRLKKELKDMGDDFS